MKILKYQVCCMVSQLIQLSKTFKCVTLIDYL